MTEEIECGTKTSCSSGQEIGQTLDVRSFTSGRDELQQVKENRNGRGKEQVRVGMNDLMQTK
jgi:hypothetical protein